MRLLLAAFFIVTFAAAGTSQTGSRPREQFVRLEFTDQHVSIFVLAENDLSKFRTKGTNVEVVANCSKHLLQLSGAGEVAYKMHRIAFSSQGVAVDGKQLPAESRNFVLTPSGEVREGFVRTFDREPHK